MPAPPLGSEPAIDSTFAIMPVLRSACRPFVGDDLSVVRQAARLHDFHDARHLGDVVKRIPNLLLQGGAVLRTFGAESHDVLLLGAADDQPQSAEHRVALADLVDLPLS